MKKNTRNLLLIVMCALSFTACKKDQMMPSPGENTVTASNGNAALLTPAPTYILQRRGTDSILYNGDGRVAKVIHQFGYTQYSYAPGFITAKKYGNGLLEHEDLYSISGDGRVVEQVSTGYTNSPTGAIVTTHVYKFGYTNHRLGKKYRKDAPNMRQEFAYDGTGSLVNIKSYNSNNQLVMTYTYGSSNVANKLKLNVEKQGLDMYLPIYGTPSKQMVEHQTSKLADGTLIGDEWLSYSVNGDGYPISFDRWDAMQNKATGTVIFRYKPMRASK
jgi:hypothetical protein